MMMMAFHPPKNLGKKVWTKENPTKFNSTVWCNIPHPSFLIDHHLEVGATYRVLEAAMVKSNSDLHSANVAQAFQWLGDTLGWMIPFREPTFPTSHLWKRMIIFRSALGRDMLVPRSDPSPPYSISCFESLTAHTPEKLIGKEEDPVSFWSFFLLNRGISMQKTELFSSRWSWNPQLPKKKGTLILKFKKGI